MNSVKPNVRYGDLLKYILYENLRLEVKTEGDLSIKSQDTRTTRCAQEDIITHMAHCTLV